MSSPEESAAPAPKKRKLQRACDYCRSKKSDGSGMPNNRCSKCTAHQIECTYLLGQNNSYPRSYVEDLESRLERMERLMNKLLPDKDVAKELDDTRLDNDPANALTPASERSHASGSRVGTPRSPSTLTVTLPTPVSVDNSADSDQDEEEDGGTELDEDLAEGMRKLSMNSRSLRYHGKSSGLIFIRSAIALKDEYAGSGPPPKRDAPYPWLKRFVEDDFPMIEESSFPPRDLLDALVDLYFSHMNAHLPLLHEPTFKKSVEAREHLRIGGFGATVLLVCAIGSRFTRDPRVLLDYSDNHHSAGWKWFLIVERLRRMSFAPAKIYDLQIYALMALFLQGTTTPQSTWSVIGAGIRVALDVGAHRKKMYSATPTVEEELWRRAFWILVMMEWVTGYGLGRPSSIHDEDFDLALPTECDDEYWLTPEGVPLFKQPPGKPSKITAFVCTLRLGQILAFAMRTIFSTNKSRAQLGQSDQQWEQRIVADLDSALNKWSDSLPSHLRWNPEQEDVFFLTQAASLSAFHYYAQCAVHRPFLSGSRRESPLSFPSVIICTNGARASIQVLEVLYKRTGSPSFRNMGVLFASGIILSTNILGLKRAGRVVNTGKDLVLVEKAIEMLRSLRYEIHVAEPLGDLLNELADAIKGPLAPKAAVAVRAQGSPVTFKRPIPEQRAEYPGSTRKPAPGGGNDAGAGPSFASTASVPPGVTPTMPPSLAFLQPDSSSFALPFGAGDIGSFARGFAGSSTQIGAANQALQNEHSFLPLHDPLAPQSTSISQAGTGQGVQGQGQDQFVMGGGQVFGLEPLGYNESMSFLSSVSVSEAQAGTNGPSYASSEPIAHDALAGAGPTSASGGRADTGMPDFALIDDALMVWSNLPPAVGWEEWGAYFSDTNNVGT